jgi:glycosyltransferase involved in cell wall biosynthesis
MKDCRIMRILVYCDEDLNVAAGGARQVLELAKALVSCDHTVMVVAPQPAAEGRDLHDSDRVDVRFVSVVRWGGLRPLSFLLGSLTILSRTVREWRPDVLIWFDSPGQMAPLWVLQHHACPFVYFVNGLPHEEVQGLWQRTPIRQLLSYGLKQAARRAEALVSVCPEVLSGLDRLQHVEAERCTVIRNGVDPDLFFPQSHEKARVQLGIDGAGPYIGFVGGFFPWHGLETLVESIPLVASAYPGLQVLLVGEGRTKAGLENLVQRKGLTRHVRFVGRAECSTVPTWIAACDVCVVLHKQTRSYPGDSMKLWEYLACGRPVVTTVGPGCGDVVESIGCGLAAAPDDPHDLARQIVHLLMEPDTRIRMGELGRASILKSHTWKVRARELEAVCCAAIRGRTETSVHDAMATSRRSYGRL